MATDIILGIRADADMSDAERALGDVGVAARDAASDIERASRESKAAAASLDDVAGAADGTATNASTLAGAFGDVAAGLGLIGLGGFSDELEAAAPALMLVAGTADIASVAMNTLSIANIKARATTVAKAVAEKASVVATKAMTAAQWALNVAMRANPIGLIITALTLLVAGIVVAYKKSDTFRALVQKVGEVGRKAIGWIVDRVSDLVSWVKDKAPAAWKKLRDTAVGFFKAITTPHRLLIKGLGELLGWLRERLPAAWRFVKDVAVGAFRLITTPARTMLGIIKDVGGWVRDRIPGAFRHAKDIAVDMIDKITGPIEWLIDKIQDLVDWIGNIDWPSPPDWLSDLGGILTVGPASGGGVTGRNAGSTSGGVVNNYYDIHVSGALDPEAVARQIEALLAGRAKRIGMIPGVA